MEILTVGSAYCAGYFTEKFDVGNVIRRQVT